MLILFIFVKPINFDAKKEETEISIGFLPQTMGVYEKWNYTTNDWLCSSPCIADLNKDGFLEVFIGSHDDNLYCFNHAGGLEWNYTTGGDVWSSPTIAAQGTLHKFNLSSTFLEKSLDIYRSKEPISGKHLNRILKGLTKYI